jgi:minor histocompatibility antigen H13
MVKVATNLDVPIKLQWPKSINFKDTSGFTMLGLGDVIVPGIFIALCLRYDYDRFVRSGKSQGIVGETFRKPYFIAAMTAYVLGLVTTMSVMHFFKAAQPALLYLR